MNVIKFEEYFIRKNELVIEKIDYSSFKHLVYEGTANELNKIEGIWLSDVSSYHRRTKDTLIVHDNNTIIQISSNLHSASAYWGTWFCERYGTGNISIYLNDMKIIVFNLDSCEISCEFYGNKYSIYVAKDKKYEEYIACSKMIVYDWSFTVSSKLHVLLDIEIGDRYMDNEENSHSSAVRLTKTYSISISNGDISINEVEDKLGIMQYKVYKLTKY